MKLRFLQLITTAYFLLVFLLLKKFSFLPIAFLIIAILIDYFTNLRDGIKNLLYFLSALSVFPILLSIFLLYLPFAVFGFLLTKRRFIRNYVLGFAISFIPVNLIYFITTYLSISLSFVKIALLFYLLPAIAIITLRKKSVSALELNNKEVILISIILFFTTLTAINIIHDKNLFMANGVRIFSRVQTAVNGLKDYGLIPIYNPAIAQGEATYLWNTPSFKVHSALANFLLPYPPILFFNTQSFFILLLAVLSLSELFWSIANKEESIINTLAITAVAAAIGLNFYFLQMLESFKAYYSYPIAYLLLGIIIDNPKDFKDFVVIMYILALFPTIHMPYGAGVLVIAGSLLLLIKISDFRNKTAMAFFKWLLANKLKLLSAFIIIIFIVLLPLFYIAPSFIYKDFLFKAEKELSYKDIKSDAIDFFSEFFKYRVKILSLKYPDVNRIDDHKSGFFVAIFGVASLFLLMIMHKNKEIRNFRAFAFAYILNLIILSLITARISSQIGGFYRTVEPYLIILMGAGIVTFVCLFSRHIKLALIGIIAIAFIHTIPYARQNITNIHAEPFAGGEIYKGEIEFIKKLPIDGRVMTYGLFSNAVDFGAGYLTGRYFSRNERIELSLERNIFEKIHSQNSFGDPSVLLNKSGVELSNYLILGGYKYLFLNICHPIGNFVASRVYPNFSYPIYQNNCMVFLVVNNTNYAEKVELVKDVGEETYKKPGGYKYSAMAYGSKYESDIAELKDLGNETPKIEALKFERVSPTKVRIFGDFKDNDWVVFKEQYFPRWRAYIGNKEISVLATNHDLILIKAIEGNEIILEYSVLNIEKIFGVASLIGLLGLSIVLFILILFEN